MTNKWVTWLAIGGILSIGLIVLCAMVIVPHAVFAAIAGSAITHIFDEKSRDKEIERLQK